jgi:hypothetical protein
LQYAVFFGANKAIEALLNAGAFLHRLVDYESLVFTNLQLALMGAHTETAKLLIERGADINQQDLVGETVLHKAVDQLDIPFVKLLLSSKNIKVNVFSYSFKTRKYYSSLVLTNYSTPSGY